MATPLVTDLSDPLASAVLEQLFRDHSGMVYRTAYGVTGNREDAQDILQTIFLRLVRRELPHDFRQTPKAYFYRAAACEAHQFGATPLTEFSHCHSGG